MLFTLDLFLCVSQHCLSVRGRPLSVSLPNLLFNSCKGLIIKSVSFTQLDGWGGGWIHRDMGQKLMGKAGRSVVKPSLSPQKAEPPII